MLPECVYSYNVKHLVNAKFLLVAALGLIPFDLNQFLWHKKVLVKIKGEQFKVFRERSFKQHLLLQSILEVCIESMGAMMAGLFS